MYETFYGFTERPFELTANPKFLYLSASQREALSNLEYGLSASKALTVLIGEVGTGKTTLLQAALASDLCQHVRCVYLNNPTLRPDDFIRLLASKLNLGREAGESKALLLDQLERLLAERHAAGEITALVVDEAQSLSHEMFEEIRFLANIETPSVKLLPVVMAGQPELAERLEQPELRQLKQRVTLRAVLRPFDIEETAGYIASRIVTAGGVPGRIFSLEAVTLIHEMSGGIARTISVICDNVLVTGMAVGRHRIDRAMVMEVCADLGLSAAPRAAAPRAGGDRSQPRKYGMETGDPNTLAADQKGDQAAKAEGRSLPAGTEPRTERYQARQTALAGRRLGRSVTE
jgi:general secretion pathway protein A